MTIIIILTLVNVLMTWMSWVLNDNILKMHQLFLNESVKKMNKDAGL